MVEELFLVSDNLKILFYKEKLLLARIIIRLIPNPEATLFGIMGTKYHATRLRVITRSRLVMY
jgi:hypothetical protein